MQDLEAVWQQVQDEVAEDAFRNGYCPACAAWVATMDGAAEFPGEDGARVLNRLFSRADAKMHTCATHC